MKYTDKISVIKQLRLVTNTAQEWNALYGGLKYSARTEGETRPSGHTSVRNKEDEASFIYNHICQEVEERYDLDLDEFLEDYTASSRSLGGDLPDLKRVEYNKQKFWTEENIHRFILTYMRPSPSVQDFGGIRKKEISRLSSFNQALLLCWLHNWLPVFDEKRGDTSTAALKQLAGEARQVFVRMYQETPFPNSAFPDSYYEQLCAREEITRLDFYHYVCVVLGNILSLLDPSELHDVSVSVEYFHLDELSADQKVIWREPGSPYFWTFRNHLNDYFFTRYDSHHKSYIQFEGCMFMEEGQSMLLMRSPRCLPYYLQNVPEPNALFRKVPVSFEQEGGDEEEAPVTAIHFNLNDSNLGSLKEVPQKLVREKMTHYLQEQLDTYRDEFAEYAYEVRYVEKLKSPLFLFVFRNQKELGQGMKTVTSWYRIPIFSPQNEDLFYDIKSDETVLNLDYKGEKYLYFPHYRKAFRVTTLQDCNQQNIAIVRYPMPLPVCSSLTDYNVLHMHTEETDDRCLVVTSQVEVTHQDGREAVYTYRETMGGMSFREDEIEGEPATYQIEMIDHRDK